MKLQTIARLVKSLTDDEMAEAIYVGNQQRLDGEHILSNYTLDIVEMFMVLRHKLNRPPRTTLQQTADRGA